MKEASLVLVGIKKSQTFTVLHCNTDSSLEVEDNA